MVIQGSNNVPLNVYIVEKGAPTQLNGSSVTLIVKAGTRRISKMSTIVGNGLVTAMLTSADLSSPGTYYVQAIVSYTDGREFLSEVTTFIVGASL